MKAVGFGLPALRAIAQDFAMRCTLATTFRLMLSMLLAWAFVPGVLAQVAEDNRFDFQQRWGTPERPGQPQPQAPQPPREPIVPSAVVLTTGDVLRDVALLPAPVKRTRDRLIAAARTGDLDAVKAVVAASPVRVILDPSGSEEAIKIWHTQYPDSEGREVLAILLNILDSGFVRLSPDTPDEIYVWPYFAHVPVRTLDPPQLVELFRLVTAYDYQQMKATDTYSFFKLGIGADGTLHYFLVGE